MGNTIINRQWVFNNVMWHLKNETKFFTSSAIMQMVGVDVWKKISEDIEYPTANISVVVSAGSVSVSTPSDFVKLKNHKTTVMRMLDPTITMASGVPDNYWLDDYGVINWYPPSIGAGTVIIPYVNEPTSLSTDAGVNELTERGCHAAVYWIVSECMLRDNDSRYTAYLSLYQNEVARLKSLYGEICGLPGMLATHEAPVRIKP